MNSADRTVIVIIAVVREQRAHPQRTISASGSLPVLNRAHCFCPAVMRARSRKGLFASGESAAVQKLQPRPTLRVARLYTRRPGKLETAIRHYQPPAFASCDLSTSGTNAIAATRVSRFIYTELIYSSTNVIRALRQM